MVETETKIQRYDSYKDSGIEWLGDIPEHWEVIKLKFLSEIKTGEKDTVDRNDDGQYPFFIRSKSVQRIHTYSYDEEAVLTAGDGDIGKIFHYINGKFEYHQRVYKFSGFRKIIAKCLYYYLHYNLAEEVVKLSAKTTVDSLRLPMLQNFFVAVPPLPEQTKIAQFLDDKTTKIDDAIAIKEQQIQLLKERKQILIHKAVTQGVTSSGDEKPNVTLKDSGVEWIGEIPEHWEVKRLKHCLIINNGSDYKHIQTDEGYPVIGSGGQFAFASDYMYDGEVVLLGRKGTIDKPLYFEGKFWAVDTMFYANAINGNIVKYLYYLATTLPFSYYSTATALPSMTQGDLNNHPISRPPIDEQKKIVDYIENGTKKIETAISLKQQEIDKLKEYKRSLINGVVTGKVRVC